MPSKDKVDREVEALIERALGIEDNTVHPGEPTASAIIAILLREVADLRGRVAELEEK
jgi:hypothetical protein